VRKAWLLIFGPGVGKVRTEFIFVIVLVSILCCEKKPEKKFKGKRFIMSYILRRFSVCLAGFTLLSLRFCRIS
jgi:hypothetical protein